MNEIHVFQHNLKKKPPENEGLDGLHTNENLKLKSMGFRGLDLLSIY